MSASGLRAIARRAVREFGGLGALALGIIGIGVGVLTSISALLGTVLVMTGSVLVLGGFLAWTFPVLLRLRIRLAPSVPGQDEFLARTQTVRIQVLWDRARRFLRLDNRGQLLIYAPTGVWEASQKKREWFGTIATCLVNALPDESRKSELLRNLRDGRDVDKDATTSLDAFYGVFGLPRPPDANDPEGINAYGSKLDAIKEVFTPLNGVETAHLRYLETDVGTIPGTGVIAFDKSNVAFAFAVRGRYQVDYTVFLLDVPEIGEEISNWFHNHVLGHIADSNIIQEMSLGIDIEKGFEAIREKYIGSSGALPRQPGDLSEG